MKSTEVTCLAIDFGASHGRAMLGSFVGEAVTLEELHTFPNNPLKLPTGLHWNVLQLFQEALTSLEKAARCHHPPISIGLDTWGIDFGLLDSSGSLLGIPFHYRDPRTNGLMERAFLRMSRSEIFAHTGIQFMEINTLYQLLALIENHSPTITAAETFLTIPDLFNYWLTGVRASELTISSTTQCYDPRNGDWAWPVIQAMSLPEQIFRPILQPGTNLGEIRPVLIDMTGAKGVEVILPACHDTSSAAAAVPTDSEDFAFISSGTWSLVGVETSVPLIDDKSLKCNFTNEVGVSDHFLFMKNIVGMWLLQECVRTWNHQGLILDYAQLNQRAMTAEPFRSLIHPNDPRFMLPGDMTARIVDACQETGQPVPGSIGEFTRCVLESLALAYRDILNQMENEFSHPIEVIHIIGGGSQNNLLNQMTANATGKPVVAGPVEATALGNILVQLIALDVFPDLSAARAAVRRSSSLRSFTPTQIDDWDEVYARWKKYWGKFG